MMVAEPAALKTIGERIKWAMDARRMKGVDLATACGITPSAVTQWTKGGTQIGAKSAVRAADALGINLAWLTEGTGPIWSEAKEAPPLPMALQIDPPPPTHQSPIKANRVPILSWSKAAQAKAIINNHLTSRITDHTETIPTSSRIGPHTFALRIENDSMAPSFPVGSIVIFEPDAVPQPSDYVVADIGGGTITFKQLAREDGDWYLVGTKGFPPKLIPSLDCIIGVAIELTLKIKQ